MDDDISSLLPVLYVEDGKSILRFSEIFGVHEPLKKAVKRDGRYVVPKGLYFYSSSVLELLCVS